MMRAGRVYFALEPVGNHVRVHVRVPPEPRWAFRALHPPMGVLQAVYAIWPDATKVPDPSYLDGPVSFLPERIVSLRGVLR